jgi:predicted nucleic acid-binding protein
MSSSFHIGDADGLIAMISKKDASHDRAKKIIKSISERGEKILFPATAVTEAITTVQVRLQNPDLAKELAEKVKASALLIIPVDAVILELAVDLYNPAGSKKNTMFDATVAATAKKYGTQTIFSFDEWYRKIGFTLLKG